MGAKMTIFYSLILIFLEKVHASAFERTLLSTRLAPLTMHPFIKYFLIVLLKKRRFCILVASNRKAPNANHPLHSVKDYTIRGEKVMLGRDIALLYNIGTEAFNHTIKINIKRFPKNCVFRLTKGTALLSGISNNARAYLYHFPLKKQLLFKKTLP